MTFLPVRITCGVCRNERPFVQRGEEEGIPAYHWAPCPDHPDADAGPRLCTFCGDRSRRCSVHRCQRDAEGHEAHGVVQEDADVFLIVALCAKHRPELDPEGPGLSKHYVGPFDTFDQAKNWWLGG